MIYVMSDVHGCYDKYMQMLEKIAFKDSDTLYMLGDVVDRGDDPIKVLRDMRLRPNVRPIMGNHDYIALTLILQLASAESIDGELQEDFQLWFSDGGLTTMKRFLELPPDEQQQVIQYLSTFSTHETVIVSGKRYILVHAGLPDGSTPDNLDSFRIQDFVAAQTDYKKQYFVDAFLVTGHVPTDLIDAECKGKVYRRHNHIAIDAGAVFGGVLACVCLDTGAEYYV